MGNLLNNCQKPAQRRVGESDLDSVEINQGEFPRKNFDIYDNPEDIIIEVTTHTKWEYHEGRQLLSKFRQISEGENIISKSIFHDKLLPSLLASLMKDVNTFAEQNGDVFDKLAQSMWRLFLEYGTGKDGIDFVSFVKLLGLACKGTAEERATVVFHVFDVDLDGHWNEKEIGLFLSECNQSYLKLDDIATWDVDPKKSKKRKKRRKEGGDAVDSGEGGDEEVMSDDDGKELENDEDEENRDMPPPGEDGDDERQPLTEDATSQPDEDLEIDEQTPGPSGQNGDFEAVGSQSQRTADLETDPWELIAEQLRKRKNNRDRIPEETAVAYLARCLHLPTLLSSFYILPSKREERETIRSLMDQATMELGSKWFIVSAEWWNQWAAYVDFDKTTRGGGDDDGKVATEDVADTSAFFASHAARSMRPLQVQNSELLDDKSHHPVLKSDLRENEHYQLVPGGVWNQLVEWYGGGPPISREVVCVQKDVRDRIWELTFPRARAEHEESEAASAKSARKKPENSREKAAFDEKMSELMMELNMTCNPQALRIDLKPVYAVCYSLNDKGRVNTHDMKPINITRYATVIEFYQYVCAVLGIDPSQFSGKARPRLWQLINDRGDLSPVGMLYPRPKSKEKIVLVVEDQVFPAFIDQVEAHNRAVDDVVVTALNDGGEDAAEVNDDGDGHDVDAPAPVESDAIEERTQEEESAEQETEAGLTEEDLDDLGSLGISSGIYVAIELPDDRGMYRLADPHDESWKRLQAGLTIDCRDSLGKWYEAKIEKVKLIDMAAPEEPVVTDGEQTADSSATTSPSGGAAQSAKGTPASAKKNKAPNGKIEEPPTIKFASVFVHYKQWARKWDEWIVLKREIVCTCAHVCDKPDSHRIAKPRTQTEYKNYSSSGRYGTSYGGSWGRGARTSMSGAPTIKGVVGLSNLGNTCFMNSILQCLSNTPHLRSFFLSQQYRQDINKNNVLGTGGRLANEFFGLLADMWSGQYKVVAPRSMKRAIGHFAPQFEGYQQHDSQEFLSFLLDGLHEDLNLVKDKPYTEKIESDGRPDSVVSKLAWQIHLLRNRSKIVDLFQCQVKSKVHCPECDRVSVTFDPLMYLSLPIPGQMKKEVVLDVIIQGQSLPIRHVFVVNKYDRVRVMAEEVAEIYQHREDFVLFYEIWNNKVQRELDKNTWVSQIHARDKVVAYLLKDWNAMITPEEIKERKIKLMLGQFNMSLGHSDIAQSMTSKGGTTASSSSSRYGGTSSRITTRGFSNRSYVSYRETFYFGMPLVISYLNISTRKELHHLIRDRIRNIAPQLFEGPPPPREENPAEEAPPAENGAEQASEATGGVEDGGDAPPTFAQAEADPEVAPATEEPAAEAVEAVDAPEATSGAAPPSYDEANGAEDDEKFLDNLPYRLIIFDDYRKRNAYNKGKYAESMFVPYDDELFVETVALQRGNTELQFCVEWKEEYLHLVQKALGEVKRSESYDKYKASASANSRGSQNLTIFDCINNYCHEEVLSKGEEWYCSVCQKFQQATKKLDLWSFPEILVIHFKRFQMLGGRRGEKINLPIDFPLRSLDLSRYVIDDELTTKPVYDLYAVSCHSGGLGGGHYTAFARHPQEHRWFSFNDSNVRPAQESEVHTPAAYVCFYRKCH